MLIVSMIVHPCRFCRCRACEADGVEVHDEATGRPKFYELAAPLSRVNGAFAVVAHDCPGRTSIRERVDARRAMRTLILDILHRSEASDGQD